MKATRSARRRARRLRTRFGRLDKALLRRAAENRSPGSDRFFTRISDLADNGVLWFGVAGVLTATGHRRPRTGAASGLIGLGVASTMVNGPLKFLWRRDRPPVDSHAALLPLPRTFSFPSGHSASAFAFATGVTTAMPPAGAAVLPMASAVAYSRVHTGVHYPSDVIVGSALGALAGFAVGRVANRVRASSVHRPDARVLSEPRPARAILVSSPHSGSADDLDDARVALAEAGITIEQDVDVADVDELARRLQSSSDPGLMVIAAGGDGTVGAVTNAVTGTSTVMGIIPLGTSNDVARSLGIPPHPIEAAQALAAGVVAVVDVGQLSTANGENRKFMNAATIGVNVAFAEMATESSMRERFGGLTYPVSAAKAVRKHVPFDCTLDYDGKRKTLKLVHLSVSNAPVFGGLLGIRVPGASLTDGLLDVIAVEKLSPSQLALALADTVIGRHKPVRKVHAIRVRSLAISGDHDQEIALDGELVGGLPAEFTIRPEALRVVIPRSG